MRSWLVQLCSCFRVLGLGEGAVDVLLRVQMRGEVHGKSGLLTDISSSSRVFSCTLR